MLGTTPTNKQPALRPLPFIGDYNKLNERDLRLQCDAMQPISDRLVGPSMYVRTYVHTNYVLANDQVQFAESCENREVGVTAM